MTFVSIFLVRLLTFLYASSEKSKKIEFFFYLNTKTQFIQLSSNFYYLVNHKSCPNRLFTIYYCNHLGYSTLSGPVVSTRGHDGIQLHWLWIDRVVEWVIYPAFHYFSCFPVPHFQRIRFVEP